MRSFKLSELIVEKIHFNDWGRWDCIVRLPVDAENPRGGKWLLFPENHQVEVIWERVLLLLAANRLGNAIKVSGDNKDCRESYVICIYTSDYENVEDVLRVLTTLWRNGLSSSPILKYKTDDATKLGVFASDYAAQRAGFDISKKKELSKKCSFYFSPKPSEEDISGATEKIQLFLSDVGAERDAALLAELRKDICDTETKLTFYSPPRITRPDPRHFDLK